MRHTKKDCLLLSTSMSNMCDNTARGKRCQVRDDEITLVLTCFWNSRNQEVSMYPGEGTVAAERFTQSADLGCPRDLGWDCNA